MTADLEHKLRSPFRARDILGLKERVGRERASDFVAFDVSYAVQEMSKTGVKGSQTVPYVLEMSVVL